MRPYPPRVSAGANHSGWRDPRYLLRSRVAVLRWSLPHRQQPLTRSHKGISPERRSALTLLTNRMAPRPVSFAPRSDARFPFHDGPLLLTRRHQRVAILVAALPRRTEAVLR